MHAERVDGYNPLAIVDAIERKKKVLEAGRGPVLQDTVTYRLAGHSPADVPSYREDSEVALWRQQDALINYREYLKENGHADDERLEAFRADIAERLMQVLKASISLEVSPRINLQADAIGDMMFSNQYKDHMADGEPEVLIPKEESRLKTTLKKHRFGLKDGKPLSRLQTVTYAEALFEATIHRFYEDPTMIAYGEEKSRLGWRV